MGKCKQAGRPMKPENEVILAALPKLRSAENFHSWGEIAGIFGVSRSTVLGLAHRHGWTGRQQSKSNAQAARARKRVIDSAVERSLSREPSKPRQIGA